MFAAPKFRRKRQPLHHWTTSSGPPPRDKLGEEFKQEASHSQITPTARWGRWQCEALTEGLLSSRQDGPPPRSGEDLGAAETREVAGWVLDQILVMLHPFMPFITEELWHSLADPAVPRRYDVIHAKWPAPQAEVDAEATAEIEWLIKLVGEVRTAKNELGIAPGVKMDAFVRDANPATVARLANQAATLSRLARLENITVGDAPEGGSIQLVVEDATFVLPLEGVIDLDAERARLTKGIEAAAKERDAVAGRLSNAAFVERAKPEAVEKARADHAEKAAEAERLTAALARLG